MADKVEYKQEGNSKEWELFATEKQGKKIETWWDFSMVILYFSQVMV